MVNLLSICLVEVQHTPAVVAGRERAAQTEKVLKSGCAEQM